MQDVRQSRYYANYLQSLGWVIEKNDSAYIFIKKFSFFGSFIKIQRPQKIPSKKILLFLKMKYKARSISLELNEKDNTKLLSKESVVNNSPYLPTKTIHIDLNNSQETLFSNFSEAKRRAIRRAQKNNVVVTSSSIKVFSEMKAKSFWPIGFLMRRDLSKLWEAFPNENKTILTAFSNHKPIAAVFLLFYDKCAYYWMAAATTDGKKLFAPSLLVWESLLIAKKKKCTIFDFEGIYDERFHNSTKHWLGFTKFKKGFGGSEITFPNPLIIKL